jgi:hypothetical protein
MTLDLAFKNVPILGRMTALMDSLYLPRGSGEEKRKEAVKQIGDRQKLIETTGTMNTLLIFAEGGTSNNACILKFKKGAFVSECKIKPILLNYKVGSIHPAWDIIEFLPLAIL